MFVIKYKKLFLGLSLFFITLALFSVGFFGLKLGIDFTGGSALELSFKGERPLVATIEDRLTNIGFGKSLVQPTGDDGILIKTRVISDEERAIIINAVTEGGTIAASQESFTTIGPSVGKELKNKAIVSIILVLVSIIFFVAYAFRKVGQRVSSWKYGFAVILALVHDIIIPTGFFALFGYLFGVEVDTLFIVALLTTLALSVSDTIVVFDRIRENITLDTNRDKSFEQIVGESLSQTFVRSINTSLMSLVTVIALALFGPESTKFFAITLAIGMFFGIYSSIFMASPLLVLMEGSKK